MPIYEYTCNACGKNFETLVMGSDIPTCPACSSEDLARRMSKCGFISKSTGPGGQIQTTKSAGSSACAGCSSTNCSSCSSSATIGVNMKSIICIGTRGSTLALWQANHVKTQH